jgi:hypothetical protein
MADEKPSLAKLIHAARARQTELHDKRMVLQERLHAKLEETFGAERHPEVIDLRAQIKALQTEKYDIDQGLSAAVKTQPGTAVLAAE